MNNFKKLYTAETLKNNKIVTVVMLPMEESIMFPVSQVIDLMKQGENVLYFSFNHDSVKINDFLQSSLKHEESPEKITGNLGVIDSYQIPSDVDWMKFIEDTIVNVKSEMSINYVVMDLMPFVVNPADDEKLVSMANKLAFMHQITSILVKTVTWDVFTKTENQEESLKYIEEFMKKNLIDTLSKTSKSLIEHSDYIIGVQREKKNFWKKLINFLLFWRKRNNFTLKVIKNRRGSDGQSYRMNIDMDNFKTEVL